MSMFPSGKRVKARSKPVIGSAREAHWSEFNRDGK
jgi:hypothetical protein